MGWLWDIIMNKNRRLHVYRIKAKPTSNISKEVWGKIPLCDPELESLLPVSVVHTELDRPREKVIS